MLHTTNFMDTYHIELLKLVEHICLIVIKGHLVKNAAIRSHLLESESKYVSLKSVTPVYTIRWQQYLVLAVAATHLVCKRRGRWCSQARGTGRRQTLRYRARWRATCTICTITWTVCPVVHITLRRKRRKIPLKHGHNKELFKLSSGCRRNGWNLRAQPR